VTDSDDLPASFRLAFVPGATPAKWVRIWDERKPDVPLVLHGVSAAEACQVLQDGGADAGLVRLPVDRTVFSAIPLYTETTVVVVPKDHLVTAADEVTVQDLADEVVWHPLDEVLDWEQRPGQPAYERPATTEDALALVAAGVGVVLAPQSLARLYHRRDLTYRPVTDAPVSSVALAWPEARTTDLVDDFIGVVRGRTPNSTRGRRAAAEQQPQKKERPARDRAAGKGGAQRRASGRGTRGGASRAGGRSGRPRRRP
jgi:DNA-binding transcriptional LysR family regulator